MFTEGKVYANMQDITSKLEEQGDERLRQLEENELYVFCVAIIG